MKKALLSVEQLARTWGKTRAAVEKLIQRKRIMMIERLNKQEAEKGCLPWDKGGAGGKDGNKRAYINLSDPAIPSFVKLRYHHQAISQQPQPMAAPSFGQADLAPVSGPGPSACSTTTLNPPGADIQGESTVSPSSVPGAFSPLIAAAHEELTDKEVYRQTYIKTPAYNRLRADKYEIILAEMAGLNGRELKRAIEEWNRKYANFHTSYPRVTQARKAVERDGKQALLGRYGKSGESKVTAAWHEAFASRYLKEGQPSVHSCWVGALGEANRFDPAITAGNFPPEAAFLREIHRKVSAQSICFHREGYEVWKRKFSYYADRDYSNMAPGEVYVSDHAQVDVAVRLPNGKIVFPWVTVFTDMRTDKYLGWTAYPGNPNSDRIFEAFYRSVRDYGVPSDLVIDNGKDYRCLDFAGGRKTVKVAVDEVRTTAVLLKNKEWFSKHMLGYRGGNVKERPGVLKDEIKRGDILEWAQFEKLIDDFFTTVANRMQSNGKRLQGACPDELFEKKRKAPVKVREDSLAILCMRSSKPYPIHRNGIHDAEHEAWLWGEWMDAYKRQQVYMRRDSKNWRTAWIFTADGKDQYLGEAKADTPPAALARTDEEKANVKMHIERGRRGAKFAKQGAGAIERRSPETLIGDMARGAQLLNAERGYTPDREQPKVIEARATVFDNVSKERERQAKLGTQDLSTIRPPRREGKSKPFVFVADRRRAEEERNAQTTSLPMGAE